MDDQYHNLSLRLYEILDLVGASEEMRDKFREQAIVMEITRTMIHNLFKPGIRFTCYVFGSNFEGSTTLGMHSDVDLLSCPGTTVVERISDAPQHGLSFLMVADETTKPGYFKLQCVGNKVPLSNIDTITHERLETDTYGRICLRNVHQGNVIFRNINGPAVTKTGENGVQDQDLVFAYRCQHITSFAKSWLRRVIRCNRLHKTQIHLLKGSGCFFVGKNHPLSENVPIEWRQSFSLQERVLMASLNSTQHKCYVLLKMIKKDIIQKRVPGSISSYHCKTCLLYAGETTPCEFWTRRNLLKCTFLCIKLLLHWVKEQDCPNYFMPGENMFDRLEYSTLRQVHVALEDMVKHWCTFLWALTCDNIGKVVYDVLLGRGPSIISVKHGNVSKRALLIYATLNEQFRTSLHVCLNECGSRSALHLLSKLHSLQTHLLHTECVRDHTEKETRQAIRSFIPHIRLQILQCIASIILTTGVGDLPKIWFDMFKYYIEESKDCDLISAFLIVASYCLQSQRYDSCEAILLKCETALKSHVVSVCGCRRNQPIFLNKAYKELVRMFGSHDIPYKEFAKTCTTGCLSLLPHLANLVPPALHYEMYRSANTPPASRNGEYDLGFNWIVVDSRVYLYFLQYVLYSKTNKPVYKQDAIGNLVNVVSTDINLGHKETALNLLGWICKQENKVQHAMWCFLKSWKIRPIHNAAKWHALEMIRSINILN